MNNCLDNYRAKYRSRTAALLLALVGGAVVSRSPAASPVVSMRLDPFAMRTGPDTCRIVVQVDPHVVSMRLQNSFIFYRGQLNRDLALYDDGTHGDAVPGDHTFTCNEVSFDLANDPFFAGQPLISTTYSIASAAIRYDSGVIETTMIDHPLTVRLIRNENYVRPQIAPLGADGQMSEHCLNLKVAATPASNYDFDPATVTRRYYSLLPDDRDFLVIEDAFQRSVRTLAGFYVAIKNKDSGFGVGHFDGTGAHGSCSKLQGYVRSLSELNSGLLNHELLHRWAAFLDDLGLSSGSHWRAILRPSSGFGPAWGAYHDFRLLSGRTYRASFNTTGFVYSDFELYLMGLVDASLVTWPIQYLANATQLSTGFDPVTQTQYRDFEADGIGSITLAQVVGRYGARTPAAPLAQRRFKLGTIVVLDRLLTEVELAYYDMLAKEYGRSSSAWPNFVGFGAATLGRAEMDTVLPGCHDGIRLEPLGLGQVRVTSAERTPTPSPVGEMLTK
jgi:hypothetical protein